jgi:hypothetical protein
VRCIDLWGNEFHADYMVLAKLRFCIPDEVLFHVVSAMIPPFMLPKLLSSLCMRERGPDLEPIIIWHSNDRPNIHIVVEEMQHALTSWLDFDRALKLHGYLTGDSGVEPLSPLPVWYLSTNGKNQKKAANMNGTMHRTTISKLKLFGSTLE